MGRIQSAVLWVWDFVVGDPVLVGGAALGLVVTWFIAMVNHKALNGIAGAGFFVIIVLALLVSLQRR